MSEILRGGGRGGEAFTARDCWNYAFNELTRSTDTVEEPDERVVAAVSGVAWVIAAYTMERSGREQDEAQ